MGNPRYLLELEGDEEDAGSLVELGLELDPVEPEGGDCRSAVLLKSSVLYCTAVLLQGVFFDWSYENF